MTRILVIEDEQNLRDDLLIMLAFEGFESVGAENGLNGLARAQENSPDLIICDIAMPELDGYGVIAALRQNPQTAAIPLIFLSSHKSVVDVQRGLALGAADYLSKPIVIQELLATITLHLSGRG